MDVPGVTRQHANSTSHSFSLTGTMSILWGGGAGKKGQEDESLHQGSRNIGPPWPPMFLLHKLCFPSCTYLMMRPFQNEYQGLKWMTVFSACLLSVMWIMKCWGIVHLWLFLTASYIVWLLYVLNGFFMSLLVCPWFIWNISLVMGA